MREREKNVTEKNFLAIHKFMYNIIMQVMPYVYTQKEVKIYHDKKMMQNIMP